MDKDLLDKRIADLDNAVQQSLANHNMLLGRLGEARYFLEQLNMQKVVDDNPGEVIPNDEVVE